MAKTKDAAKKAGAPNYRAELAKLMTATISDELASHDWTYEAVRPMPVPPKPWHSGLHVRGDCSKGVQYLCWWAGTPFDPMGNDWNPWGNSATLWLRLQHLASARDLLVGDVVTFGPGGDDHATMVLEPASAANGWDPLLWSFGRQGSPNSYRLSQDNRPAQFLRLPLPKYVPTPDDKLRARTGWFAWVAWRLGEGDWQSHVAAAPGVRPAVPRMIPPNWWVRYARFLANRKRGNKPAGR